MRLISSKQSLRRQKLNLSLLQERIFGKGRGGGGLEKQAVQSILQTQKSQKRGLQNKVFLPQGKLQEESAGKSKAGGEQE